MINFIGIGTSMGEFLQYTSTSILYDFSIEYQQTISNRLYLIFTKVSEVEGKEIIHTNQIIVARFKITNYHRVKVISRYFIIFLIY